MCEILQYRGAVEAIKTAILQSQYEALKSVNKPMGVATYNTTDDMPESLRKALPDTEELKKNVGGLK